MNRRPSLDDLAAASAVATHRSFRRAADALSLSPSTLSHTVRALEDRLGVRLLQRTTRSVTPTDAGTRFFDRLRPLLADLDSMLGEVTSAQGQPTGILRISTGEGGARLLLERIVPAFLARYPAVSLELLTQEKLVDIVADGLDAGVRLAEAVPLDMVAVPLGSTTRFVALASPDYLARHPAPRTPQELLSHRCIRFRLQSGRLYRWEFARRDQELAIDVPGALTLDSTTLAMRAAAAGLGIAFGPESGASAFLANGELVEVLADWCPSWPGLQLYYPMHRHMTPALRAFVDVVHDTRRLSADPDGSPAPTSPTPP